MSHRTAFITGITGQDGSYLAELLLSKGYIVYGLVRRTSSVVKSRIDHLYVEPHDPAARLFLEYGDLAEGSSLRRLIWDIQPDEIYNLAAQSHVRISFEQSEYTADITGIGVLRMLEAMREYVAKTEKPVRFYQASSSEMFGSTPPPQSEESPLRPRSPYAVSKVAAYWHTANFRDAHDLHCSNGILFNHESERRGENFVTRKISIAAGRIKLGMQRELYLGNLDARRDWGYAPDYVAAMWSMLQQDRPGDYVIATGESHTIREFLDEAFGLLGLDWRAFVKTDPYYLRPSEVEALQGDASKARQILKWRPTVGFHELVRKMVEHDLELAEREAFSNGFRKTVVLSSHAAVS